MALDNLATLLRMNQIFRPDIPLESGFPSGDIVLQRNPNMVPRVNIKTAALDNNQDQSQNIDQVMSSMYHPSNVFSDMYNEALSQMPQRQQPTWKNRLVGGLLGATGDLNKAEAGLYPGYNRAMGDWETKMKYLQPGMQYERYQNANERSAAYQTAQTILRQRQLDQQAERDRKAAEQRDYANQIRAQLARGGQVVTDDKTNQAYMVYKDGTKIPLDITKMSPFDLEEFRQSGRMALESERQGNRIDLEQMRQTSREELQNLRNDIQMELMRQRYELAGQNKWSNPVQAFDKDGKPLNYALTVNGITGESKKIPLDALMRTVSPGAGGKESVQSETQKAAGISNKALQVKSEHPEWSKYIKTDPKTGKFTGITTPGLIFGPKQEDYNKMYETIYGEPFTATPVNLKENSTTKPNVGDIKTFPNGKKGRWDGKGWALVEEGATK